MSVVVLIADMETDEAVNAITAQYPENYKFGYGKWAVATNDLTATVIENIGGQDGGLETRIVAFSVSGFYGWHLKDLWEYLERNS